MRLTHDSLKEKTGRSRIYSWVPWLVGAGLKTGVYRMRAVEGRDGRVVCLRRGRVLHNGAWLILLLQ
jgi:hypothetical protein